MRLTSFHLGAFAAAVLACFAACGSESNNSLGGPGLDGGGGSAAQGGGPGGTSSGGTGATSGNGGLLIDTGTGATAGTGGGFDPDSGCAAEVQSGENIPVAIYIMLDKSGSMTEMSGGGQTKWDAVRAAMTSFVNDTQSAGLDVGIQYFPTPAAGAPTSCTDSSQCGSYGPCLLRTCDGTGVVIPCDTNADCGPGEGNCVPLGQCQSGGFCLPPGGSCGLFDACQGIGSSVCTNLNCDVPTYTTPDVAIATLPGAAMPIVNSLNAQMPAGRTPTSAALQGALDHASSFLSSNPSHTVAVVLATDGLPTECDTNVSNIAQIAGTAFGATPSISTFVIGVFGPSEPMGPANADQIAQAGGTTSAFIVDPTQNVTQQFIDALNAIRGSTLGCEFQIPLPQDGGVLDFTKVNVSFSDSSGTSQDLFYVEDQSQCDPTSGGWYYDANPASGGTPTKIIVCSSTCDSFEMAVGATVEIVLGCETVNKPPQ